MMKLIEWYRYTGPQQRSVVLGMALTLGIPAFFLVIYLFG